MQSEGSDTGSHRAGEHENVLVVDSSLMPFATTVLMPLREIKRFSDAEGPISVLCPMAEKATESVGRMLQIASLRASMLRSARVCQAGKRSSISSGSDKDR